MPERIFLLDGMALAYRAYFAFINNPLKNSKGENTSAVYGFINSLLKILDDEKPEYIAVAFDTKEPTFRHKQFSNYKATREKMPEDMIPQLHYLKELTEALGVPVIELPGYEADDVIGTLSVRAARENIHVYMVTGDKDFMQLITDRITMYNPLKKGVDKEIIDAAGVREKFGVDPGSVTDILGLMGDTADNIPGVKGVGEKTAQKLISEFGSIENLYANIESVKGKIKENLLTHKANAFLSKSLATIDTDSPVPVDVHSLRTQPRQISLLVELLQKLEFNSLVKRLTKDIDLFSAGGDDPVAKQKSNENYSIIRTEADLMELTARLEKAKAFSWNTVVDGPDPLQTVLVGMAFSFREHEAFYVPVNGELHLKTILQHLRKPLENPGIEKLGQNTKHDMLVLSNHGVAVLGHFFDTMIAAHLIHSDKEITLEALALEHLQHNKASVSEITGSGKNQMTVAGLPVEKAAEYANEDADCVMRLYPVLKKLLADADSLKSFETIDMPLLPALESMERHGVWLDLGILSEMSKEFAKQIEHFEKTIFKEAGSEFNMNSPQQLGEILFDKMQIHKLAGIEKPKLTGKTKQYATDVKILEQYKSLPIIDAILSYRQLTKLKSTYIDGLPPLLNPKTQRVHTTFNQTIAATGRLSSTNPNFQNIPIRTDMGREIRKAFRPQEKKWHLLSADYSQIELRVMAHMSGDEHLIEAFQNDEDIHTSTASRVFGVPPAAVTKDLRRKAKDINFGIIYGISPFGLAQRIGMSQAEAREFIQNYFATYPKVKSYIDSIITNGRANGFVTTLFGRRRYLSDLQSKNYTVRQFAERAATNTPIQGTAAEIIKVAMIDIHRAFSESHFRTKMILQVHDELVFEVPDEELKEISVLVTKKMESAVTLKVPVKVDLGTGDNWLETK